MNNCIFKIETFSYTPKTKMISDRKEIFRRRLIKWANENPTKLKEYPAWMRKDFFEYWTELANDNGRKMRWELEKTWNTGRRLATAKKTIYSKDPRWSQTHFKAPVRKDNNYGDIDYKKAKERLKTSENNSGSLGDILKRNWNANA